MATVWTPQGGMTIGNPIQQRTQRFGGGRSSRRNGGGSSGGGMSTRENPTPSAGELFGSAEERQRQIDAFREGGQQAFEREREQARERARQEEQQRRQEQERREQQRRERAERGRLTGQLEGETKEKFLIDVPPERTFLEKLRQKISQESRKFEQEEREKGLGLQEASFPRVGGLFASTLGSGIAIPVIETAQLGLSLASGIFGSAKIFIDKPRSTTRSIYGGVKSQFTPKIIPESTKEIFGKISLPVSKFIRSGRIDVAEQFGASLKQQPTAGTSRILGEVALSKTGGKVVSMGVRSIEKLAGLPKTKILSVNLDESLKVSNEKFTKQVGVAAVERKGLFGTEQFEVGFESFSTIRKAKENLKKVRYGDTILTITTSPNSKLFDIDSILQGTIRKRGDIDLITGKRLVEEGEDIFSAFKGRLKINKKKGKVEFPFGINEPSEKIIKISKKGKKTDFFGITGTISGSSKKIFESFVLGDNIISGKYIFSKARAVPIKMINEVSNFIKGDFSGIKFLRGNSLEVYNVSRKKLKTFKEDILQSFRKDLPKKLQTIIEEKTSTTGNKQLYILKNKISKAELKATLNNIQRLQMEQVVSNIGNVLNGKTGIAPISVTNIIPKITPISRSNTTITVTTTQPSFLPPPSPTIIQESSQSYKTTQTGKIIFGISNASNTSQKFGQPTGQKYKLKQKTGQKPDVGQVLIPIVIPATNSIQRPRIRQTSKSEKDTIRIPRNPVIINPPHKIKRWEFISRQDFKRKPKQKKKKEEDFKFGSPIGIGFTASIFNIRGAFPKERFKGFGLLPNQLRVIPK